jgi:GDSL-like Lipase/Acylhydrolase family
MYEMKSRLLSSSGLTLLAALVLSVGCSSSGSSSGAGGSPSSGGSDAAGGASATSGGAGNATGGASTTSGGAGNAAGGTTGAGGNGTGGSPAGGGAGILVNPRITLLGDSTTSDGCFRAHLSQMLTGAGHPFTFVGTRSGNPSCIGAFNQTNEGHGGYIVTQILDAVSTGRPGGADASDPYTSSSADLALWFDGHPTDVVLMNFGTNDVSNAQPPATIINAFTAILTKLRSINPNVRMMVAQIPPIAWEYCTFPVCDPRVRALNAAIVTWAGQQNTADSPVTAVDLYTGYDTMTDTVDGVHANESGSTKIANAWYAALAPLF